MGLKEYSREKKLLIHLHVFSQKGMYLNHLRMFSSTLSSRNFGEGSTATPPTPPTHTHTHTHMHTHTHLHSIPTPLPQHSALLIIHSRAFQPTLNRKFFPNSLLHSQTFLLYQWKRRTAAHSLVQ